MNFSKVLPLDGLEMVGFEGLSAAWGWAMGLPAAWGWGGRGGALEVANWGRVRVVEGEFVAEGSLLFP